MDKRSRLLGVLIAGTILISLLLLSCAPKATPVPGPTPTPTLTPAPTPTARATPAVWFAAGLAQVQQASQLRDVEADHDFTLDDGHRRGHVAKLLQLCQGRRVFGDVSLLEGNLLLRKKLFRLPAEESPRLRVKSD